ncbi:MAG: PIN domain-containing protein [Pseudomonadota bacterium]
MAGHGRYTVLLDACVLYPRTMPDALMSLAAVNLFAAKWTEKIEHEWMSNLEINKPQIAHRLTERRDAMRRVAKDREVPTSAWRPLVQGLVLPDPDDRHVLAAAIAGHVDCIVTVNLKDFPDEVLEPHGLEAVHPDQFIINQWDLDELVVLAAFKRMRSRWNNPAVTPEGFAQAVERGGLPWTAQRLRDAAELIQPL